jgi:hypothetical protein
VELLDRVGRDIEEQVIGAVGDDRGAQGQQHLNGLPAEQVADRNSGGLGGIKELRRFLHPGADVEPGRADQKAEDIRNAPSPIHQLLMRQQGRQGDAEQRDDDRDDPGAGPLPACSVTLARGAVLDQEGDRAAELATDRKPLQ